MAVLDINAQAATSSTGNITWTAANSDGFYFTNTGFEFILVNNASGSDITLQVYKQVTLDGDAVYNKQVTIGAGKIGLSGPFSKTYYSYPPSSANSGKVKFVTSATSSITVAVMKFVPPLA